MELTETFTFRGDRVRWGADGEGEPLVLLHGTPFSSVVWRRIAPHLARRRRVYAFDLLGHGASEQHAGQDVSLGVRGATALRTHLLDGRDYRTLTLIDPVAQSPHGSPLVQAARRHADAYAELPPYLHEAVLRAYVAGAVHRTLDDTEMRRYLDPWLGEAFTRPSTARSPRWTTGSPTRSRTASPTSVAR